jgi:peptidoglycan/LPS O-acetylase OafA/YrhL
MTKMPEKADRYVFIDALRGIAALAVLFHHLLHNTVLEVTLRRILPVWAQVLSHHGVLGVEIFFVISGFVIAHSLRATPTTPRAMGNFILRRQLRLDPPYWTMLAFTLLLAAIEARIPGLVRGALPSVRTILINLFYLQNVTGMDQILPVAWTLCLEIQFYLLFIVILSTGAFFGRPTKGEVTVGTTTIVFVIGALSLGLSSRQHNFGAWFLPLWVYFAGGCLCCWALTRRINTWIFITFSVLFGMVAAALRMPAMNAGLVTVVGLYVVGRMGHLTDWLGGPIPQYFGRISYSLYLVHLPVLSVVMRGGYKLTHTNRWAAIGWFFAAAMCSVLVAHLLYVLVERPSMRLASKLKPRPVTARILAAGIENPVGPGGLVIAGGQIVNA